MTTRNEIIRRRNGNAIARANRDKLFREFMTPFDRLFDDFFRNTAPEFQGRYGGDFFEKGAYPKVDIRDTQSEVVVEAAVPGMSRNDISVDIHDNVLTISGEKQEETEAEGTYVSRELKRSSFRRSWRLPDNLDQENITARFEDGMLYLTLPKLIPDEKTDEPRRIEIR